MAAKKPQILSGIIHVTGPHDVGKTLFALGCGAKVTRIAFYDDDVKGRSTVHEITSSGIEFGKYVDIAELAKGKTELELHELIMKDLAGIKANQYDALVFDTWTRFGASFHSAITATPNRFRKEWARKGDIKGAQEWKVAREYEKDVLGEISRKVPTVILVTHLKQSYATGGVAIPDKFAPDASSTLDTACRLRIWLRPNPTGRPVPVGLVLKRLNKTEINNGVISPINVLPRKLVPLEDEPTLWHTIWRYWDNPVGDRAPTQEEMPDEYELSVLDGGLTEEQRVTFHEILRTYSAIMDEEEGFKGSVSNISEDQAEEVRMLVDQGKPLPVIAKEVGIPVSELTKLIKDVQFMKEPA